MSTDTNDQRRRELGDFLRSRRLRLAPETVGLTNSGQRRHAGLRREDVARLAGLSLSWYTWLEQGRPISVSSRALDGIADALRLTQEERAHVFELAGQSPPASSRISENVSPAVQRMLDNFEFVPCYIIGVRWDVLAWNAAAEAVYGFEALETADRNMLVYIFCLPIARNLFTDWPMIAERAVARFRMSAGPFLGEASFRTLIERIEANSTEFREMWAHKDVLPPGASKRVLYRPNTGNLTFEQHLLGISETPNLRLVLDNPTLDTDTREAIRRALGR